MQDIKPKAWENGALVNIVAFWAYVATSISLWFSMSMVFGTRPLEPELCSIMQRLEPSLW